MPPKRKNKSQATGPLRSSLRSKGPAIEAQNTLLADPGTSGPSRAGITLQPPVVDTPIGPDVTPQPEPMIMKIPLRRRAKALSVQPSPIVAQEASLEATGTLNELVQPTPVVAQEEPTNALREPESAARDVVPVSDLFPGTTAVPASHSPAGAQAPEESEHSDIEFEPSSAKRFPQPKVNVPQPNVPEPSSSPGPETLATYRKQIEDRGESLFRRFNDVDEPFLRSLDHAERKTGGPRAVLARLTKIAREEIHQKISDQFIDDDLEMERKTDQEYSRRILECVRRMMITEGSIRPPSNKNRKKMAQNIPPGGLLGISEVSGEEVSNDTDYDFEGDDHEDEPAKYKEKNRRGNQEKQDGAMSGDGEGSEEGGTPRYIRRTKLNKDELQIATDLWDNIINPMCIKFEGDTGKPAEAMREAIAGVIARHVRQNNTWNIWQKLWWKRHAKVHDRTVMKQQCHEAYQGELKRHKTQEELDVWTRELEDDLAQVHDLSAQAKPAKRVVDLQRELINISSRAARDHIHVLFFACSVNPYSNEAQAMSGFGVGSEEMRSLLVNNNQILALQVMLSDLRTKLANQELENRKANKLPSVSGSGCMLKYAECSGTERLDPRTPFKLFEREDVVGPSSLVPQDNHDDRTTNNVVQLPLLPANETLAQAVSQVSIPTEDWPSLHIYKLFVLLVDPPPGLDFSAMEGLCDYLAQLLVVIGSLVENGIRAIASRCWWLIPAMCENSTNVRKRADWIPILEILRINKKRLMNWCPSIEFLNKKGFPKTRGALRSMMTMFFNPDPARRLRLVPIEGIITDTTPILITPIVPGGVSHGYTAAKTIVTVEPSTVSRWLQPMDAVREPGPTTQSAAVALPTQHAVTPITSGTVTSAPTNSVGLLPMSQGLGVSSSDQLPLGFFHMDPRSFTPSDPTDVFSLPSSSFLTSGAATTLYENDAQNLAFGSSAIMGPSSSTFIPPSGNASTQGRGEKRSFQSQATQNDSIKRRRIHEPPARVVEQVGFERPTTAIGPPVPVTSFNRVPWMSVGDSMEYIKFLEAKIATEGRGPAPN